MSASEDFYFVLHKFTHYYSYHYHHHHNHFIWSRKYVFVSNKMRVGNTTQNSLELTVAQCRVSTWTLYNHFCRQSCFLQDIKFGHLDRMSVIFLYYYCSF